MHAIKMKIRPLLGAAVSVSVLCGVAMMMLSNASPYVTAAQAKTTKGNNLHLQGDLIKESVKVDHQNMQVSFTIKDDDGQTLDVVHKGLPPANMGDATRVVAVGGMQGGTFTSHKLITKCPSKYESEPGKHPESVKIDQS